MDSLTYSPIDLLYAARLLEELAAILEAELGQYRDFLDMLRAQRQYFAAGDIEAFEETGKRQGTTVLKIKTLEEARKSVVRSLAQCFGVSEDGLTLAKLATLVDSPYSERCVALREEILSITKALENLRESNAYLMQHALHYVNGVLRIFASSDSRVGPRVRGGREKGGRSWDASAFASGTPNGVSKDSYSSIGQLNGRFIRSGKGKRVSGWM